MLIYNITTQVGWHVHEAWKKWMLEDCIPEMMSTGYFSHFQMVRLLESDDADGPTYAVQMYVNSTSSIEEYKSKHVDGMRSRERSLWGESAFSFSSLMEVIN